MSPDNSSFFFTSMQPKALSYSLSFVLFLIFYAQLLFMLFDNFIATNSFLYNSVLLLSSPMTVAMAVADPLRDTWKTFTGD